MKGSPPTYRLQMSFYVLLKLAVVEITLHGVGDGWLKECGKPVE
jgi:hypothetical protein